jgi:hypothetical protein
LQHKVPSHRGAVANLVRACLQTTLPNAGQA